jgi:hypothetical protein
LFFADKDLINEIVSLATALPSSSIADSSRLNNARAESRAILNEFSARVVTLSRQATTAVLDPLQQNLVTAVLAQVESLLADAAAGTLSDVALLQTLVDVASTVIVPRYVSDGFCVKKCRGERGGD